MKSAESVSTSSSITSRTRARTAAERWRRLTGMGLIAAGMLSLPVAAQGVYRCGNSYGQRPCEGGQRIEVEDARDADQRAQSERAVRSDAALGQQLEQARLRDEARAEAARPFPPIVMPEPAVAPAQPQVFRARAMGERRHRFRKPQDTQATVQDTSKPRNIQLPR